MKTAGSSANTTIRYNGSIIKVLILYIKTSYSTYKYNTCFDPTRYIVNITATKRTEPTIHYNTVSAFISKYSFRHN